MNTTISIYSGACCCAGSSRSVVCGGFISYLRFDWIEIGDFVWFDAYLQAQAQNKKHRTHKQYSDNTVVNDANNHSLAHSLPRGRMGWGRNSRASVLLARFTTSIGVLL